MLIPRQMAAPLMAAAREYPVVTLTGPRQAGKTTLVRAVFPGHRYCNLENPETRRLAREDPKQFFHLHPVSCSTPETFFREPATTPSATSKTRATV